MKGYLLDTNVVSDWLDATRPRHAPISKRISELRDGQDLMVTSVIVLGEIEYGIQTASASDHPMLKVLRDQVQAQFVQKRLLLNVTQSTVSVYGRLRAALFDKYAPSKSRRVKRPEQLVDPVTSKSLGIQENDLWIAAQALERNFVLVTNDTMLRIREVAPELIAEDWGASAS